jgi:hypothetical protein
MGSAVGVGAMLYDQRMIWRSTAQLFDKLAADRVAPSPPVQVLWLPVCCLAVVYS